MYCEFKPDFHKCKPWLIQNAPDFYRDLLEEASAKETDEVSNCFLSTLNSNGIAPSGDILKGSFYANPIFDTPTTDESLVQRYPSYCGSNIWPDRALPELEVAFKALGKLILDVGLMVAYHCDRYGNSS
ncbi:hypothetical protein CsSME_00051161 [Camellia sinensis var. sinensis]